MNNDEKVSFFAGFMSGMVLIGSVLSVFAVNERRETRREAITRGYAEWVVDADGNTAFQWKKQPEAKK